MVENCLTGRIICVTSRNYSDGVLRDKSLALRRLEDTFKVLGLGLKSLALILALEVMSSSSPLSRLVCPRMFMNVK